MQNLSVRDVVGRQTFGKKDYLSLRTQVNVVKYLALSRQRLGSLLSNRIKNFTGAGAKPEQRRLPEVRNLGWGGRVLSHFPPEVTRPFVESY